jgi:hypothetical protein
MRPNKTLSRAARLRQQEVSKNVATHYVTGGSGLHRPAGQRRCYIRAPRPAGGCGQSRGSCGVRCVLQSAGSCAARPVASLVGLPGQVSMKPGRRTPTANGMSCMRAEAATAPTAMTWKAARPLAMASPAVTWGTEDGTAESALFKPSSWPEALAFGAAVAAAVFVVLYFG